MNIREWLLLAGLLLLATSLLGGWMRKTPLTPFALYAATGIVVGPWVAGVASIDLVKGAWLIERITEVALVVSLFVGGLRLRVVWHGASWRAALRLGVPAMLLTIAGSAVAAHYLLGVTWPISLLLGAAIAPTDPVLASLVSVDDAGDDDELRVSLSGEAGINDGATLPLLLLALLLHAGNMDTHAWGWWLLRDVVWAIPAGAAIGFGLAQVIGLLATRLKVLSRDTGPNDLLALSLVALSYAAAQYLHASVFIAAFAAGMGLRHAEWRIVSRHPNPEVEESSIHPPAELLVNPHKREPDEAAKPAASIGLVVSDALTFGDPFERLIAAALLVLLGIAFASYFSVEGLVLAALLFFVIRPAAVLISTVACGLSMPRRIILGWLGVRGIGSLYYLAYATNHGLSAEESASLARWIVPLVVASVALHGMSTQPIMTWRAARIAARSKSTPQ